MCKIYLKLMTKRCTVALFRPAAMKLGRESYFACLLLTLAPNTHVLHINKSYHKSKGGITALVSYPTWLLSSAKSVQNSCKKTSKVSVWLTRGWHFSKSTSTDRALSHLQDCGLYVINKPKASRYSVREATIHAPLAINNGHWRAGFLCYVGWSRDFAYLVYFRSTFCYF